MPVAPVKARVRAICATLDERILIPEKSRLLELRQEGDAVQVSLGGRAYRFPKSEVSLLPLPNVTIEALAQHVWGELAPSLAASPVRRLRVEVEETSGQSAALRSGPHGLEAQVGPAAARGQPVAGAQPAALGAGHERRVGADAVEVVAADRELAVGAVGEARSRGRARRSGSAPRSSSCMRASRVREDVERDVGLERLMLGHLAVVGVDVEAAAEREGARVARACTRPRRRRLARSTTV